MSGSDEDGDPTHDLIESFLESDKGLHYDRVADALKNGANVNFLSNFDDDHKDFTPAHWAALVGHSETMTALLDKGADVNGKALSKNGSPPTPLHVAIDALRSQKGMQNKFGECLDVALLLVSKGANVNVKDRTGNTPLHKAIQHQLDDVAVCLLNHNADLSITNSQGESAEQYASMMLGADSARRSATNQLTNFLRILRVLNQVIDVNDLDSSKQSILHWLGHAGHHNLVKKLVAMGAHVNLQDKEGKTPLHRAAEEGKTEAAKALLQCGADPAIEDAKGRTPAHLAIDFVWDDTANLLEKHVAEKEKPNVLRIFEGHEGSVSCVAVQGSIMVTGGFDNILAVWHTQNLGVSRKLTGHTGNVSCVTLSDHFAFSGSADRTVREWDLTSGEIINIYRGHMGEVTALKKWGNELFSGSLDGTVRRWDIETKECLQIFEPDEDDPITCLDITSGILFAGSSGAVVRMWDIHATPDPEDVRSENIRLGCFWYREESLGSLGKRSVWSREPDFKMWETDTRVLPEVTALAAYKDSNSGEINVAFGTDDGQLIGFRFARGSVPSGDDEGADGHGGERVAPVVGCKDKDDNSPVYELAVDSITVIAKVKGLPYVGFRNGRMRKLNMHSGELGKTIHTGHRQPLTSLFITGSTAYSGSSDRTVIVVDFRRGFVHKLPMYSVRFVSAIVCIGLMFVNIFTVFRARSMLYKLRDKTQHSFVAWRKNVIQEFIMLILDIFCLLVIPVIAILPYRRNLVKLQLRRNGFLRQDAFPGITVKCSYPWFQVHRMRNEAKMRIRLKDVKFEEKWDSHFPEEESAVQPQTVVPKLLAEYGPEVVSMFFQMLFFFFNIDETTYAPASRKQALVAFQNLMRHNTWKTKYLMLYQQDGASVANEWFMLGFLHHYTHNKNITATHMLGPDGVEYKHHGTDFMKYFDPKADYKDKTEEKEARERYIILLRFFDKMFPCDTSTHKDPVFRMEMIILGNFADIFIDFGRRTLFQGHNQTISCVAFDSETNEIYSGSDDAMILSWGANSASLKRRFLGHNGTVTALAVRNGRLFSGSGDATAREWDVETQQLTREFHGHTGPITCLLLLEGAMFTASSDKRVCKWSLDQNVRNPLEFSTSFSFGAIETMCYHDDFIFVGCSDGYIQQFHVDDPSCLREYHGHRQGITRLQVIDGFLYSCSEDGMVKKWDIQWHDLVVGDETFTPQDIGVYFQGMREMFSVVDKDSTGAIGMDEFYKVIRDSKNVRFEEAKRHFHRIDTNKSGNISWSNFVKITDRPQFLSGHSGKDSFYLGFCLKTFISHRNVVTDMLAHEGHLYTGSLDGTVVQLDLEKEEEVQTFYTGTVKFVRVVDNSLLAVAVKDENDRDVVRIYDLESKELLHDLEGHSNDITVCEVKEGDVFTGSEDWTLRRFDAKGGRSQNQFKSIKGSNFFMLISIFALFAEFIQIVGFAFSAREKSWESDQLKDAGEGTANAQLSLTLTRQDYLDTIFYPLVAFVFLYFTINIAQVGFNFAKNARLNCRYFKGWRRVMWNVIFYLTKLIAWSFTTVMYIPGMRLFMQLLICEEDQYGVSSSCVQGSELKITLICLACLFAYVFAALRLSAVTGDIMKIQHGTLIHWGRDDLKKARENNHFASKAEAKFEWLFVLMKTLLCAIGVFIQDPEKVELQLGLLLGTCLILFVMLFSFKRFHDIRMNGIDCAIRMGMVWIMTLALLQQDLPSENIILIGTIPVMVICGTLYVVIMKKLGRAGSSRVAAVSVSP